jgi:hypothetical protein
MHNAVADSAVDESADSETWSDYVPVAVHSVPFEPNSRTEPHSRSIGEANEPHNDRDIENLAIEIAELQQMMDRVGSKVKPSCASMQKCCISTTYLLWDRRIQCLQF